MLTVSLVSGHLPIKPLWMREGSIISRQFSAYLKHDADERVEISRVKIMQISIGLHCRQLKSMPMLAAKFEFAYLYLQRISNATIAPYDCWLQIIYKPLVYKDIRENSTGFFISIDARYSKKLKITVHAGENDLICSWQLSHFRVFQEDSNKHSDETVIKYNAQGLKYKECMDYMKV